MLDLLSSIIDSIIAIFGFLINVVTSLITFVLHIPTYVTFLVSSIGIMPTVLIPFLTLTITLYVVLFLINRR